MRNAKTHYIEFKISFFVHYYHDTCVVYNFQGWGLHLVSTINEWIIGLSIVVYFLTYIKDFSKIKLNIKSEEMYKPQENTATPTAGEDDVDPIWTAEDNMSQNN